MSDQFVAEIRIVGFNFAPIGWALCNGQILPISQNTALFSLLGTNYGGNGISNFALPNLAGSAPIGAGQGAGLSNRFLGESGGEQTVTLNANQMPAHSHTPQAAASGGLATPENNFWASAIRGRPPAYAAPGSNVGMNPALIGSAGGGYPHNNMPPYLCMNFVIALQGIFPPRS